MNGAEIRLGQLFDRESGRSFIAAFDHGLTLGPKPASESVLDGLQRIVAGNPDGILISPGTMKIGGHLFAVRGLPSRSCARTGSITARSIRGCRHCCKTLARRAL